MFMHRHQLKVFKSHVTLRLLTGLSQGHFSGPRFGYLCWQCFQESYFR